MQRVELDDAELARLRRILAVKNLEQQRWIAYPLWALAVALNAVGFALLALGGTIVGVVMIGFGYLALIVGMARYGYYRLFRMLHYMASTSGRTAGVDADERQGG